MGDEVKLVISGDSAGGIAAIQKFNESLAEAGGRHLPAAGKSAESFMDKMDKMGRESRLAMRAVGDVTMFAGFSKEMQTAVMVGGNAADMLGDLAGGFAAINPVMLAMVGAGAAVSLIFSKIQEETKRAQAEIDAIKKPFAEFRQELAALTQLKGVDRVAADLKVNRDALETYAKSSQTASVALINLSETQESLALKTNELAQAEAYLREMQAALGEDVEYAGQIALQQQNVNRLKGEVESLIGTYNRLRDSQINAINATSARDDAADRQHRANAQAATQYAANRKKAEEEVAKAAEEGAKRYADAMQRVADAQRNILKGMVEKALTPTTVTETDMAAAALGKYSDKWDEFRRRLEAVKAGTDPAQFGAQFQQMFAGLGMPLDTAIAKFKDFSLFADPKNLKVVDWNMMTADIGNQLMQLVGKANLMKEGFARAWAGLSRDQKASLRDLGIESAGDAKKVLAGTADVGVASFVGQMGNKDTQKKIAGAGNDLISTLTKSMTDKDTMKTWTGGMDTLVQTAMTHLATKEVVKSLGDGGKSIVQSIADGVTNGHAPLNDALIAACDDAIQKAIDSILEAYGLKSKGGSGSSGSGGRKDQAAGGIGTARGGQVFVADEGEGYWFSGRDWSVPPPGRGGGGSPIIVNINSQVSLATRAEAEQVIAPYVRAAVRDAQRRGAM